MYRECDLEQITDGKQYTLSDMVKADCDDCKGCSACCHAMGSSICLDPLDVYRLLTHFHTRFEVLLEDKIELNLVDGVILPNLKMRQDLEGEPCVFLNEEGRCSIHEQRPGICRIFPLGRLYEADSFSYILQVQECPKPNKAKVKVSKWIDTPQLKRNQKFIAEWHFFLKEVQQYLLERQDEGLIKKMTMQILQSFYLEPYAVDRDFYDQFDERLALYRALLK